jgi:hypothetical protein
MHPEPPGSLVAEPKSSNKGCWMAGCGGCLGILLFCGLGSWLIFQNIRKEIAVEPFAPVELSPVEHVVLEGKVKTLQAIDPAAAPVETPAIIRLSEQEINAWIAKEASSDIRDALRLTFTPNQIGFEVRVPYNPPDRLRIRGSVEITQTAKSVNIQMKDLRIGGIAVPQFVRREMKLDEIFADLTASPELKQLTENFRLEIGNGFIEIKPASQQP